MRKLFLITFAIAAIALLFLLPGCKAEAGGSAQSGNLRVGYIDPDQLFQEFPEITEFMKKKDEKRLELSKLISSGEKLSEAEQEKVKSETQAFSEEEEVLMEKFVKTLKEASREVAKEKKYDLIINNHSTSPIIEYGGDDLTNEVRIKLNSMKGEGGEQE